MSDSSRRAKQENKTEIEEIFNRENSRDESREINLTNGKTVEIESLKFELLFNRAHKKEPSILSSRLNTIDTGNDKERSNTIDIVNDKETSNDFDSDSLDRIPSLNIDKDSLDDNVDTDSLDEIETDSLNNNKRKDKRLLNPDREDFEESPSSDKSDTDDIFVNSSNIDKSESEIYSDILKTIQNTVDNSDTEIFEDTLNTIEDSPNNNSDTYERPNIRPNSDDVFEISVNERSVKESRAALASEIQSSSYSYDKFDRFFSAIDFFEEPPSMQRGKGWALFLGASKLRTPWF
uniref:Uncharacterized protein n=1 Tax=Cacopsylla melanoneura TaxID=428564 RepID=A0A8D8T3J4_9HEMI